MKNSRRSTSPLPSASKIANTRFANRVRGSPSRSSISVIETSPLPSSSMRSNAKYTLRASLSVSMSASNTARCWCASGCVS